MTRYQEINKRSNYDCCLYWFLGMIEYLIRYSDTSEISCISAISILIWYPFQKRIKKDTFLLALILTLYYMTGLLYHVLLMQRVMFDEI